MAKKLQLQWSPRQIAGWLKRTYPDDEAFQALLAEESLSVGQRLDHGRYETFKRQLIALARALVSGAQTLIFDESTANIDTQTELMIQRALYFVMSHRTTIVIAHRLSTIRHAEEILVLADGAIVQQGNHESLLREQGLYRDMYELQSLE